MCDAVRDRDGPREHRPDDRHWRSESRYAPCLWPSRKKTLKSLAAFGMILSAAALLSPTVQSDLNRALAFDDRLVGVPMNMNIRANMPPAALLTSPPTPPTTPQALWPSYRH